MWIVQTRTSICGPIAFALWVAATTCFGQPRPAVDAIFAEWDKPNSPGVALVVVRDGRVVYERGYGRANLDYGLPLGGDSVFYMASVSKQFTAGAIALLALDGKLELDADVRKYVPELHEFDQRITVRQLVHHTSGLPDVYALMGRAGMRIGDEHSRDKLLDLIAQCETLNFAPGEKYRYSNSGYFLLAVIVERVSGQSLREFCRARIFEPLQMASTRFHDDHREIVERRVISYSKRSGEDTFQISYLANFDQVGAGGLLSCGRDMALWDANYATLQIGGPNWKEIMLSRGVLNNGETLPYAFGLVHGGYQGLRTLGHGGSMMGFRTHYLQFPDQRFSVIVLANLASIDPGKLARQVADRFLKEAIAESSRQ